MKRTITFLLAAAMLLSGVTCSAQYYKDIFMDGGMYLTSKKSLPCASYLGLKLERYYSASTKKLTEQDSLDQLSYFVGDENDSNGVLLYPDGAPRFRVIYVNGGGAGRHGRSLSPQGRQHIRDFYNAGGSYVGTCAGAYLATRSSAKYDKSCEIKFDLNTAHCREKDFGKINNNYLGIYPATAMGARMTKSRTDMTIPEESPLLRYFDFGGDNQVDSVYHNGGCFFTLYPEHFPEGAEVCAYYKNYEEDEDQRIEKGKFFLTGKISVVAYKASQQSGRAVLCGSHPEAVKSGERRDFFSSFVLYAMDGNGIPQVKGELEKGKIRRMDKKTEDEDPSYTRIGDLQYHHFTVNIPEGAKDIRFEVLGGRKGFENCNLNLYIKKGDFAFAEGADYKNEEMVSSKSMEFETLPEGEWYVAVQGATTVEVYESECGDKYKGPVEVLNGVPYTVKVSWK